MYGEKGVTVLWLLSDRERCSGTAGNRILLSSGCDAEIYELKSENKNVSPGSECSRTTFFFQIGRPVRQILTLCLPQAAFPTDLLLAVFKSHRGMDEALGHLYFFLPCSCSFVFGDLCGMQPCKINKVNCLVISRSAILKLR